MSNIKKILIANRGEIAIRVMRTCREMGIRSVAIYSEADEKSPHVLAADEAYCVGPAVASESYLRMDKIIEVAKESGADAIHPGYGFLAENPVFAQKVMDNGLIFIGPLPDTIALMGSKTESRKAMMDAGVPVVPGAREAIKTEQEADELIKTLGGYPVLIKAAAGGGGKGMRTVYQKSELARALEAARNEALKAFGDDTIYIEKFIENPKHIEIQIIADEFGNTVHLWERDCSIQRRHQKVIEECPSAVLTPSLREQMGQVAVQAAKACHYRNAGTVEFLFDDGKFYFLEMNTRLQVEHPVTEMVMGLDLVKLQIEVAEGKKLPFAQNDLQPRGWAIECRINAEDVFNNFVPTTGKITHLKFPEGPGVRMDAGITQGSEISRYYDPMAGKLIVWGEDRQTAIQRMKRALSEFQIDGIKTTIPFCLLVLDHPEFQSGKFTTKFVAQYWDELKTQFGIDPALAEVLAVAVNHHEQTKFKLQNGAATSAMLPPISPWKLQLIKG